MIDGKKLVVVLPAYNAELTLEKTYKELPHNIVDVVILVDDHSQDGTVDLANELGIDQVIWHEKNLGYGGNQKTCYAAALASGADIVVMVHPDYQYSPRLCGAMAWMVASGEYDIVIGSRILGETALRGGMPLYKYIANRLLTAFQNLLLGSKMSEFHTGYRAFSRQVLLTLPLLENSDDFVFDNQMLAQGIFFGYRAGELSCPTRYMPEASQINFRRSVKYGFGVLATSFAYRLQKWRLAHFSIFDKNGRRLQLKDNRQDSPTDKPPAS